MKKSIVAGVLGLSLLATSCIGSNNAFERTSSLNRNMHESKWVRELVFIPMTIVHGFALAGDYLIFNSMEFWGMDNPIDAPKG
jgi:hypothetical protein